MGNGTLDYSPLAHALADRLVEDGAQEHIAELFTRVPRHRFLPDVMWGEDRTRYDRAVDPDTWMRAAYTDQALTTQRDDGLDVGPGLATSSSSAPSVMARMLTAARIEPGHQVLEIGTGTGFNAALLCELVGDAQVTSMEIDPAVATAAQGALLATGHAPELVIGDAERRGTGGPVAAFHRVLVTCQMAYIPPFWQVKLRPRGLLVVPWAPTPGAPGGVLAVLQDRRGGLVGAFEGSLAFMWARGQRWAGHPAPDDAAVPAETRRVKGDPRDLLDGERGVLLSLLVPRWTHGMGMEPGASEPYMWVVSTRCGSWARLHPDGRVEQGGGRRLFDAFESALILWEGQGRPGLAEFGLSISEEGCRSVWLREPGSELWTIHAPDHDDADDVDQGDAERSR